MQPLPPECQGVILPGGYPELHAAELAASQRSQGDLRRAAAAGLPIYAECGGLLLLGQTLEDPQGAGPPHGRPAAVQRPARFPPAGLPPGHPPPAYGLLVTRRGEVPRAATNSHRWELPPATTPCRWTAAEQGCGSLRAGVARHGCEGWTTPTRSRQLAAPPLGWMFGDLPAPARRSRRQATPFPEAAVAVADAGSRCLHGSAGA